MQKNIVQNYLEKVIDEISYESLGFWRMPNITQFSNNKNLFEYQVKAIENIVKVLNLYYESEEDKKTLHQKCIEKGLEPDFYNIPMFYKKKDQQENKVYERFLFYQNHFDVLGEEKEKYISGYNFFNRACLWMATGSGKSLIIIKTIELLDYLQSQGLIPEKEIMLLFPRNDLIKQFKGKELEEFNRDRSKKIELIDLKKYDEEKQKMDFQDTIKVFYYRSDLLRDKRAENLLDYKSYENYGNWYVFLDEAHRGEKENSNIQRYVSVLSKNGFLFNFSATFTESIDYITTCKNFNLEKFISAGYGKHIYLSPTYFQFNKNKDELSEKEKQKQVLKSLTVFTLIKKSKTSKYYHHPLIITLVNSVNTEDSDLLLFFKKLEDIASNKLDKNLFDEVKIEIKEELVNNICNDVFGNEQLEFDVEKLLKDLSVQDIRLQVFNSEKPGKIEILEGEKGKEIGLRIETSTTSSPFAIIKIGDTKKFHREKLGNNYSYTSSFEEKKYFEKINNSKEINLLIGSRSFYEGWDSNRPNVINMINIGKKDAKKYVLQGIGRGIRIEPTKGNRKRLLNGDSNKNNMLETLFVFATDKNAIKAILETVQEQKSADEYNISLFEQPYKPFELLIPTYKEDESNETNVSKFNIAEDSFEKLQKYIQNLEKNVLLIKTNLSKTNLERICKKIQNKESFQIRKDNKFTDMDFLFERVIHHFNTNKQIVSGVKKLEDEIIHFKNIKVVNLEDEEIKRFEEEIKKVKDFEPIDEAKLDKLFDKGKITKAEYKEKIKNLGNNKAESEFKDLKIKKLQQHYYLPLIYSQKEKVEYIKNILNVKSEVEFLENLDEYLSENKIKTTWMFSKLNENLDNISIPYFDKSNNILRKFNPDFIFWLKNGKNYKIIFIDPKGTTYTDYQNKIDEFEELFMLKEKPKTFKHNHLEITFDLKLIAEDINQVGTEKYKHYWIANNDFTFLKL